MYLFCSLKALLKGTSLSKYGSERFRVYGWRGCPSTVLLLSWKTEMGNTGRTVLGQRPNIGLIFGSDFWAPTAGVNSGTNEQPKEEVFGTDIPQTSGVVRADIPGQNFGQSPQVPGKTSISARTSMTRRRRRTSTTARDFQKLRSEKNWVEFPFVTNSSCSCHILGLVCMLPSTNLTSLGVFSWCPRVASYFLRFCGGCALKCEKYWRVFVPCKATSVANWRSMTPSDAIWR